MILRYYKARNKVLFAVGSVAEIAAEAAREEIIRQGLYLSSNATIAAVAVEKGTSLVAGGAQVVAAVYNGRTFGQTAFKAMQDAAKGDTLCTGLCVVACVCEAVGICYSLIPLLPGKLVVYGGTKCVSLGCVSFRDSCNAASIRIPGC